MTTPYSVQLFNVNTYYAEGEGRHNVFDSI